MPIQIRCALPLGAATLLLATCGGPAPSSDNRSGGGPPPASSGAAPAAAGVFVDVAAETGLRFSYDNGMSGHYYFPEMLPAGVGLFDMDNDGDLDVLFTQGHPLAAPESGAGTTTPGSARARLFRNDLAVAGDGRRQLRFVDVTDQSRLEARGYGMGVAAADIDNNGCIDLYLTFVGPNQLWRNNCDGTFTDVSKASHTDHPGWGVSASFFDYDRDGWLDLYVGNYVRWDIPSDKQCTGLIGRRDYCTPAVYQPEGDRLFHNNRNGTFTDVTATALKGGPHGPALGVSTADFDGDGWLDVYVANDGRANVLWMNRRDGTFENAALLSGAALAADGRPKGSMGVDAGDFDNDGDEDLFTTQLPTEGNNLYVNDGRGLFEDRSAPANLGPQSRGFTGFGTAWFDVDNDGWLDLFVANGAIEAVRERLADPIPYGERKLLFRNRGDGGFDNISERAGPAFAAYEISRGAAVGDLDNDGDTDIVVANIRGPARVLLNTSPSAHWLGLRLTGSANGRDMIGARVTLTRADGTTLIRRARSDGSYASANDPRVLFGLGGQDGRVQVEVLWPDGVAERWGDLPVDRWMTLTRGQGSRR